MSNNEYKQSLKFPEHNQPQNPNIRTAGESLFLGTPGSNPVHTTTMFSSMFNEGGYIENGDCRSFSDLLMGSASSGLTLVPENWGGGDTLMLKDGGTGFKQKRPGNLVLPVQVSPVFNISPGFSPSLFLTSPTFLSPTLSPFGMTQHHTLAQLTAQAQAAISQNESQTNLLSSMAVFNNQNPTSRQPQSSEAPLLGCQMEKRPPVNLPINVDKPADDGYNWRKYGQKQVKGSEYPRSYYRCTSANCPVKKKVERSFDGHITEIIYKGQHTHDPPQNGRRGGNKDSNLLFGSEGQQQQQGGHFRWSGKENQHSSQPTCMMLHGPSDSEESAENYQAEDEDDEEEDDDHNHEPRQKRPRHGAAGHGHGQCDGPFTHRTMTEPKIVVQTRSEVDLLDDGYRWRKYGQKVVKGNPNPRSYYKCTTVGCKVRKHVERASTDHRAVITTYEGKHSHEVPAPRGTTINNNNNNNAANYETQQLKLRTNLDFDSRNRQTPASLRLKQEQNLGST